MRNNSIYRISFYPPYKAIIIHSEPLGKKPNNNKFVISLFDKRFLLVGANITFSPQSSTEFHGVFYYFAHPVKLSVALL